MCVPFRLVATLAQAFACLLARSAARQAISSCPTKMAAFQVHYDIEKPPRSVHARKRPKPPFTGVSGPSGPEIPPPQTKSQEGSFSKSLKHARQCWEPVDHLQGSLGPSGLETPKKSEKRLPASGPGPPESLEKVSKKSFRDLSRLFPDSRDFFETFFQTLGGFRGRRPQETFFRLFWGFKPGGPERPLPCKWSTDSQRKWIVFAKKDQESPRQTKPKKGPKRKVHEFRPFL